MRLQSIRKYWGAGEWKKFSTDVRSARANDMLSGLAALKEPILVSGCQRSGTTMLTRLIVQSPEIKSIWQTKDDELDAAYILAGIRQVDPSYRYCFQVTYLNEAYYQLLDYRNQFSLLWLLRNPHSVIYSMLYNWRRYPLNELFLACGLPYMSEKDSRNFKRFGISAVPALRRACYAYLGKLDHLENLQKGLDSKQLLVVDYDRLVENVSEELEKIFTFVGLPYSSDYAQPIKGSSTQKHRELSSSDSHTISRICSRAYEETLAG